MQNSKRNQALNPSFDQTYKLRHDVPFDMNRGMSDMSQILFTIAQSMPGFLLAIVAHEWAHGWVANYWGDPTAKNAGRLTLNPMAHYDLFGTVIFPLISVVTGFALIGWARPVPIESRNFRKFRPGLFWVSFAGPLANLILGMLSAALLAYVTVTLPVDSPYFSIFRGILMYSVFINFILAFFNLLPIPPLDGGRMVSSFLKGPTLYKYESIAQYSNQIFLAIFLLSFLGISVLSPLFVPAQWLGSYAIQFFLGLFGAFS
jgi:Zn-dependent protease